MRDRKQTKNLENGAKLDIFLDDLGRPMRKMVSDLRYYAASDVHLKPGITQSIPVQNANTKLKDKHLCYIPKKTWTSTLNLDSAVSRVYSDPIA